MLCGRWRHRRVNKKLARLQADVHRVRVGMRHVYPPLATSRLWKAEMQIRNLRSELELPSHVQDSMKMDCEAVRVKEGRIRAYCDLTRYRLRMVQEKSASTTEAGDSTSSTGTSLNYPSDMGL